MTTRCSSRASNTSLICKKNYSFLINNKRYCYIHAKMAFNKYAIYIQRIWCGHKIRNKLTNIYCKLPDDLQRKILFYIRESYLLEKHHYSVIRNILDKKVANNRIKFVYWSNTYTIDDIKYLIHIYYLYNKYTLITSLDAIASLKNRVFSLKYINRDFITHVPSYATQITYQYFCNILRDTICDFQTLHCHGHGHV